MKKIKLLLAITLCFVMNLRAQTACDFSPGTIGAASETICYNENPALIANSETNNAIALFNEELYGIHHDIIALPDNTWFTGNYTIESWVKPQKVLRYIITNGTSITTYGNQMIGNVFESYAGGLEGVSFAYGDIYTYTPKLTVSGSNGSSSITSSIAIPENQWSHLAVSFNGTTATMYINGQVVATGPMALPTSVLRTYNRIGNGRSVGQFDEVRIWNVSRTVEEIMATMNVPLIGTELGLMAYYDCNQGTANVNNASITTLIDKSPNNKNATLGNQFYMFGDGSNFVNGSPATINASGGSGTFTYKWQANGVDIANSNSASYDPPAGLTATTTYTRFAKDETCNTFKQSLGSRVVTVRGNFSSGEISSSGESICINGDPVVIGSTTAASGGNGAITYKWQANGVDIANSNTASYDPPTGLTATTTYTRFAKEGTCNTSFLPSSGSYVVTMRGNLIAGEISSSGESICTNGDPAVIGSTTAASGGDGAFTYKWQANGVDIANSDSDSYDPPSGLTATTTYTRFAKDAGCSTTFSQSSGSYVVTVRGNFSTGEISSVGETICNNGDPAEIGSTTAASGGDGSITYKWQSNGVDIDDSNSASYDQPAGLTATTTYTRFAKEGTCNTSFTPSSGSYVVTVRGNFSSGEISSTGESICNNGDPAVISSTTAASSSEGAITYKWQANGVDIANSDSDSYDPPSGLTTTTTFTRFAKDGTCNTSFTPSSGSFMVTVNPNLTSSVNIVADNAVYPNAIAITASAVNGGTSPIYQWYNGTTAVGTNSATYRTSTLTVGQSLAIKVVMTSNATPCLTGSPTTSNIINIAAPIVPSVRLVSAGIGVTSTEMHPSALLEVKSDTKGFLPPRMTATERDAIASPVAGLMLYCSNCGANGELEVYNGTTWTNLGGSVAAAIVGSATATSIVSDPTNFNIKTNTVVAVDQLDITPSADFSLNTGIARNTTATNAFTNAAISRYYKFGVTTNPFSGILKINYDETELNGIAESNLKVLYHNGTTWAIDNSSTNNVSSNYVSTTFSATTLNELSVGNSFTVTFDANGGSGSMSTQSIANGASANLTDNAFTRAGYTFAGWATSSDGAVAYANSASYTMGAADVTLFAKWNSLSPTAVDQSVCFGKTVADLSATGTALIWYTEATGGNALSATTALSASATYYVSQTIDSYESLRTAVEVTVTPQPVAPTIACYETATWDTTSCAWVVTGTQAPRPTTACYETATFTDCAWVVTGTQDPEPTGLASNQSTTFNTTTCSWDVTTTHEIPASPLNLCKVAATKVSDLVGSTSLKFYSAATGTGKVLLAGTVALKTNTKYYVTETVDGVESSPRSEVSVVINDLPKAPAKLDMTNSNISSKSITKVGPYMGTGTEFTLTAAASATASHYRWELPEGASSTDLDGDNTSVEPVITVTFAGVQEGVSSLLVKVYAGNDCGESTTAKVLTLTRSLPATPTKLVLTSMRSGLNNLAAITKVGPYMGTDIEFILTATPVTTQGSEATKYHWDLPAGVNSGDLDGENNSTGPVISVIFADVESGVTALPIGVYAVNGSGTSAKAKVLSLLRALPATPSKLVLTDGETATAITTVSNYIGTDTVLTLTATPVTTQGSEATKYHWSLPEGVNSEDLDGNYNSLGPVIGVSFEGVAVGVTALPISVSAVNNTGTSKPTKPLGLKSAKPKAPGTITGAANFNPSCSGSITVSVPNVAGVTYTWSVNGTEATVESDANTATIDVSSVTTANIVISVIASNGTGSIAGKALTIKKFTTPCGKIAPKNPAVVAKAFKVVAYPNPSSSNFNLDITTSSAENVEVKVFDVIGKLINKMECSPSKVARLQIGDRYPSGVYNVIVSQGTEMKTLRVIKK